MFFCYQVCRVAAILLLGSSFALAQTSAERPRIGLVLGGGGARGFAHIGVLKVLEENHIPVDCVIGTSIGSLVGAAYASGRTPEEMAERVNKANWDDLLSSKLPRQVNSYRKKQDDSLALMNLELGLGDDLSLKLPSAAISTQKIEFFLRELTFAGTVDRFDLLPIPYRAIATDLETGEMVVIDDGDIVTAMRSSMAVPGLFPAVNTRGRLLVDGGLVRNVPVDVARQTCADVVIAIDVGSPPLKRDQISDVFSVADQYTRLMMIQNVKPQLDSLTDKDVLISPDLGNLNATDFKKGEELIVAGEKAAQAMLPQLRRYSVDVETYNEWVMARLEGRLVNRPVNQVAIKDVSYVNPEVVKDALEVKPAQELDLTDFHKNLAEVYARGDFSQLDYELNRLGDEQTVNVLPVEKSWGPNYLNLGIGFGTDFNNSMPWSVNAMYRRTWINSLGAESKTTIKLGSTQLFQTEFYQPLQLDGLIFIAPYLQYKDSPLAVYANGDQVSDYAYTRSAIGVDLGSTVSKYGELRIGPVINRYSMNKQIGLPLIFPELGLDDNGNGSSHDAGIRATLLYDQLDNYFFPTNGQYVNLSAYASLSGDQKFDDYMRFGGEFRTAHAFSDGTLLWTVKGQGATGEAPFYADVRWLGGFLNLSSYRYQELLTNRFIYGSVQYIQSLPWLSGSYWGMGLETARMFDHVNVEHDGWNYSGVAYLAYDSYLGPLYLGVAYGDNQQAAFYFMLGKQF